MLVGYRLTVNIPFESRFTVTDDDAVTRPSGLTADCTGMNVTEPVRGVLSGLSRCAWIVVRPETTAIVTIPCELVTELAVTVKVKESLVTMLDVGW